MASYRQSAGVVPDAHWSARAKILSSGQPLSSFADSSAVTASIAAELSAAYSALSKIPLTSPASTWPWKSAETRRASSFVAQARRRTWRTDFWSGTAVIWSGILKTSVFPVVNEFLQPLDLARALRLALVLLVGPDGSGRVDYL